MTSFPVVGDIWQWLGDNDFFLLLQGEFKHGEYWFEAHNLTSNEGETIVICDENIRNWRFVV